MLLRKLLNLVPHFPPTLKFIIVHLPANATSVDFYYARKIQEAVASSRRQEEFEVLVLFVTREDFKKLINHFWTLSPLEGLIANDPNYSQVFMKGSIVESTLCYSWGKATNGKLGIGIRDEQCDGVSGFARADVCPDAD